MQFAKNISNNVKKTNPKCTKNSGLICDLGKTFVGIVDFICDLLYYQCTTNLLRGVSMHHYLDDNELVAAAVAGDEQAMSAIIKSLKPCVEVQASRVSDCCSLTRSDLIQEGFLGVVRAVFGFDSSLGVKFSTYAEACVTNSIVDALRNQSRKKHTPLNSYVSLDDVELTGVNPHDPERVVFMAEEMEQIIACIENELTDLEYGVLMRHIAGDSYDEIALSLNVSTKSVDNALARARKKIKAARNT